MRQLGSQLPLRLLLLSSSFLGAVCFQQGHLHMSALIAGGSRPRDCHCSHGAFLNNTPRSMRPASCFSQSSNRRTDLYLSNGAQGDRIAGCSPLEERIMKKYIETFPAYTMEADRDLLQRRAQESIDRARQEFEAGLELEGASELSDEGLSTRDRTEKFFNDDSVRNAATDYVWKREMTRISTKDRQTTRITFNVAQVLTFLLFAPIWWYFFTNVPTREFTEVFAYSAKVVREFVAPETLAPF